jgi:hypothetical protein
VMIIQIPIERVISEARPSAAVVRTSFVLRDIGTHIRLLAVVDQSHSLGL